MSGVEAHLEVEGFNKIPTQMFKRAPLRRAFRQSGQVVAKAARKKIAARVATSDYPARQTGRLLKSLKVKVSRSGLLTKVYHEKRQDQKDFYAAYLHYGTSRGLRPRDNWIADALAAKEFEVRNTLARGMGEALA
ncbi:hypothetical protein FMZ60_08905 [Alcaligenaceae bacterium SJ-26]|nr:hypothetical protein FMZ60_08905 [Alcaligenaceae bacterium SJ-26]